MKGTLARLVDGKDLDADEAAYAFTSLVEGTATPAQIGAFLVALRMKGETEVEIEAGARVLRRHALAVPVEPDGLVCTCGTGGDGRSSINVSTAAALVAAAAGVRIAKHGNRSVSSRSGSADVLEALGLDGQMGPAAAAEALARHGVVFLFAPLYHPAMKYVAAPRRELGLRSIFNLLGPLVNPAGVRRQTLGVSEPRFVGPVAGALSRLGAVHALVFHGGGGEDELSVVAATQGLEIKDGRITSFSVDPEWVGLRRWAADDLVVDGAETSARRIEGVLAGVRGADRDAILLSAGAAIYVGGRAPDLVAGVAQAAAAVDEGRAEALLAALRGGPRA